MTEAYSKHRAYYQRNREKCIEAAKERHRRRVESGEQKAYLERTRAKRAEYKRQQRAKAGATPRELIEIRSAIRRAGRCPSVRLLVHQQHLLYWQEHPNERADFLRQRRLQLQQWRYLVDLGYRLYHRGKSKGRKAEARGNRSVILSGDDLLRRWLVFSHACAYCGSGGDLHLEHVIPISKGGEHHLGNIVPACQRCNISKGKADAEQWYRAQPSFDEERWAKVQDVIARSQPTTE